MRITITKQARDDRIDICRDDGSSVSTTFPHKGPISHDFVHYAVESELGLSTGFWGLVAAGHRPEDIQEIAKAAGHASAKRAEIPDEGFVAAIQSERIVEAFEADHWSGASGDPAGVILMAQAGCAQSHVALPLALDEAATTRLRKQIADFAARWTTLAPGEAIGLEWDEAR
jgi:hypothetical protein